MTTEAERIRDVLVTDKAFMAELREAVKVWREGGSKTTSWSQVKRELGID